ncbi:MAG: 5-(carboxyamino)imidazole ribonucleotide mutase [Candidatus Helarchaeota archaeon]|nr:5-(carboxyamino)imidazole ribonucleotide mutase [Candidatus Helarchaeota archaeon]
MTEIAIIMGSQSDEKICEKVTSILDEYTIDYEVKVISAHRNPLQLEQYVLKSEAKIFIAIAGLAAALPGVIASKTLKPVIGVPVDSKLGGLDALLSIVQMPKGVPVATVGIDNGQNAAYLALRILALSNSPLRDRLQAQSK